MLEQCPIIYNNQTIFSSSLSRENYREGEREILLIHHRVSKGEGPRRMRKKQDWQLYIHMGQLGTFICHVLKDIVTMFTMCQDRVRTDDQLNLFECQSNLGDHIYIYIYKIVKTCKPFPYLYTHLRNFNFVFGRWPD